MADARAHPASAPPPRRIEPAALAIVVVAALLTFGPAAGVWGIMLAVVVAFAIIHVGCLTVGCRARPRA